MTTCLNMDFLNEDFFILIDLEAYKIEWERSKDIIKGIRKEWANPRFRENFELLSIRAKKWL